MTRVALIHSDDHYKHFIPGHPECPERLKAIENKLGKSGLWRDCAHIEPVSAAPEDLRRVHSEAHLHLLGTTQGRVGNLDPETYYNEHTFECALLAAGGAIEATRAVLEGRTDRAFVMMRPPGHHCTRTTPMGFCLLNNVAIAARYLQARHGIGRVAIVDFDVHHGNGTQDIFYHDDSVYFCSLHQLPLWPMSGNEDERGAGRGMGTTLNVPIAPNTGPEDYIAKFDAALDQVFASKPEFLLISAGFDAHRADPLAHLRLENESFGTLTQMLVDRATDAKVQGIVSVLEGGYDLRSLAESVEVHLQALMD